MTSRTRLTDDVKAFRWQAVDAGLGESPQLLPVRDRRGRTWLHQCCMVNPAAKGLDPQDGVHTANVLLKHGLDLNDAAFTEGSWKATPLWCAIAFGQNLPLAGHLLELGCDPNHSLFAAVWNKDLTAIDLLMAHGADVDSRAEGQTPFLGAVGWSRFREAEALLRHGADVNALGDDGRTALHMALKKDSDRLHLEMLIAYGARGDIPDKDGRTAQQIMRRKRDPDLQALAGKLALSPAT